MMHKLQLDAPPSLCQPTPQAVGVVDGETHLYPGGHVVQLGKAEGTPVEFTATPAASALVELEYVPAGQLDGAVDAMRQNVPTGQDVH